MRTHIFNLFLFILIVPIFLTVTWLPAAAQQGTIDASTDHSRVEGTVISVSRVTLVVRTPDNQFQLFTYAPGVVRPTGLTPGVRVRVLAGPADESGTRTARSVSVLPAGTSGTTSEKNTVDAAPVPDQIREIEHDIKRESRRWALGVRGGAAFDPELFTFGIQSRMGPIFHPRLLFRPNAEFAFGEVTDLIALNLEMTYHLSDRTRRGWSPYLGAGPALIFIHQNFEKGRDVDFGNFDYETGFNVLMGAQSRGGTFVELKTSLYSGPAPKLRLIVGYNF